MKKNIFICNKNKNMRERFKQINEKRREDGRSLIRIEDIIEGCVYESKKGKKMKISTATIYKVFNNGDCCNKVVKMVLEYLDSKANY